MEPLLTIVATAHGEPETNRAFINSMLNQKEQDGWNAVIVNNGDNQEYWSLAQKLEQPFEVYCSEEDTGCWGTHNRESELFLCTTPYILQTSVQDVYLPNAMTHILQALRGNPDIVTFPALNHLFDYDLVPGNLAWSQIDWGQAVIKTEIAKQGKWFYERPCGDWYYFESLMKQGLLQKRVHIPKILTIHN